MRPADVYHQWGPCPGLALERAHRFSIANMMDDQLLNALRLAVGPPGGVNVQALRDLACDDDTIHWDISTVAEHLQVSPHTLRYYERVGLVTVDRDQSGYRQYDAAAVRRLVFITRMRVSGMSMSELRRYIHLVEAGDSTTDERLKLLLEHRDVLRHKIEQLQISLAATEYKITTYQEEMLNHDH